VWVRGQGCDGGSVGAHADGVELEGAEELDSGEEGDEGGVGCEERGGAAAGVGGVRGSGPGREGRVFGGRGGPGV
jgi:hypothetical protein